MPTPDEIPAAPPTPPSEPPIPSHVTFTGCPPEEERETRALRETRGDSAQSITGDNLLDEDRADRMTTQEPTPEPEQQPDTSPDQDVVEEQSKGQEARASHQVVMETSPSPSESPNLPGESSGDLKLVNSIAAENIHSVDKDDDIDDERAKYIWHSPLGGERPHPSATTSFLRPGAKFRGTQRSDRQVYDVQVDVKDVNLTESFICGYLRIQGLTDDHPTLTTFFEGEIIGPKYLFRTTHASWNSSEKIDLQHWARFPAFRPLARSAKANPAGFTLKNYLEREHLFMRWKEYFLVPDHRVKSISGASFEGFYYICFDQCAGSVSGIYFHAKSEKYQQLELRHVPDGGCMGAVEFSVSARVQIFRRTGKDRYMPGGSDGNESWKVDPPTQHSRKYIGQIYPDQQIYPATSVQLLT